MFDPIASGSGTNTLQMVDWIAAFDPTTSRVFFVQCDKWDGLASIKLRLEPPQHGQLFADMYRLQGALRASGGDRTHGRSLTRRVLYH